MSSDSQNGALRSLQRTRFSVEGTVEETDSVAVEEPLEIRVNGRAVVVLLRTPGRDEDLAIGFCISEGIIRANESGLEVRPCASTPAQAIGNVVDVIAPPEALLNFSRHAQPRFSNSACGVCGKSTLDNLLAHAPVVDDDRTVTRDELIGAPRLLLEQQPGFKASGGLHAAGLLDDNGTLACVREDVGRHNATDKTIGAWAIERPGPTRPRLLAVSSRAGFEIVEKAHLARIPIVVSVGAPTSLAAETAQLAGLTLCAFAGKNSFSVYTHPRRVR